jgi:uncharacterized damage-inducible protein DinB
MQLTVNDFINDLTQESESTLKIFSALTDESLKQKVYDDGRNLGHLAWHITLCIGEMAKYGGLSVVCPANDAPIPESVSIIIETYKTASQSLISEIKEKWTDELLETVVDMYGEKWNYAKILIVISRHEIHHRAQMTVLMRQAGLKVPGVYGPSKEEWTAYNMPPED